MDGNPLGTPEVFKNEVATLLANRGESVIAGGDLVLHLGPNLGYLKAAKNGMGAAAAPHHATEATMRCVGALLPERDLWREDCVRTESALLHRVAASRFYCHARRAETWYAHRP